MNDHNNDSPMADLLYMLLEMLQYHNSILTVNEVDSEAREEVVSDNYMAIKILKTVLRENPERSLN